MNLNCKFNMIKHFVKKILPISFIWYLVSKKEAYLKLYNKKHWNIDWESNSVIELKHLLKKKEFTFGIKDLAVFNQTLKQNVSERFNQLFSKID